jgi:hypothetical protein
MKTVHEKGVCEFCGIEIFYNGVMSGPFKIWDDPNGDYECGPEGGRLPHKPTHEDWPNPT